MSIYYQDESCFVMSQEVWRVLCLAWTKPIRHKWKEKKYQWISVSWARNINWNLYYRTSKNKKSEDFLKLLYQIRARDKNERIIYIVDNAKIHHAKKVKAYCDSHKIFLVYLPPYSPDLNPIEFTRKSYKREYRKIQWAFDTVQEWVHAAWRIVKKDIWKIDIVKFVNIE